MRWLILIALLITSPALAQEQTYTFQLTVAQANTILQALGQFPYNAAAPIIAEMQKQARAADEAKARPLAPAEKQP